MKVDILGTQYEVKQANKTNDVNLETCDGYCDTTTKEIIIGTFTPCTGSLKDLGEYEKKLTRHEIVHAFLYESGLAHNSWASNEEIVDWVAIQFNKLVKAFEETECL